MLTDDEVEKLSAAEFLEDPENDANALLEAARSFEIKLLKQGAMLSVKKSHEAALIALSGDATTADRDTWPSQLAASQAFIEGTANHLQIAMLEDLLVPDETKTELSTRIVGKNAAMQKLIGLAGGLKRRTEKAIEAAEENTDIQKALDTAAQEMQQAIKQFKTMTSTPEA